MTDEKKQLDDCIRDSKKRAWKEFTSELDPRDPTTKVWNTLESMDGRKRQPLPEAPISSGSLAARNARHKSELALRTYATMSRVKVNRLKQRDAYLEVRRRLNETPEDEDSTGDTFRM